MVANRLQTCMFSMQERAVIGVLIGKVIVRSSVHRRFLYMDASFHPVAVNGKEWMLQKRSHNLQYEMSQARTYLTVL